MCVSCRLTWAWSERVHLYVRQIMVLPGKTKTFATYMFPGRLSKSLEPGRLYWSPPTFYPVGIVFIVSVVRVEYYVFIEMCVWISHSSRVTLLTVDINGHLPNGSRLLSAFCSCTSQNPRVLLSLRYRASQSDVCLVSSFS